MSDVRPLDENEQQLFERRRRGRIIGVAATVLFFACVFYGMALVQM